MDEFLNKASFNIIYSLPLQPNKKKLIKIVVRRCRLLPHNIDLFKYLGVKSDSRSDCSYRSSLIRVHPVRQLKNNLNIQQTTK